MYSLFKAQQLEERKQLQSAPSSISHERLSQLGDDSDPFALHHDDLTEQERRGLRELRRRKLQRAEMAASQSARIESIMADVASNPQQHPSFALKEASPHHPVFRERSPEKELGNPRVSPQRYVLEKTRAEQVAIENSRKIESEYLDTLRGPLVLRERTVDKEIQSKLMRFNYKTQPERISDILASQTCTSTMHEPFDERWHSRFFSKKHDDPRNVGMFQRVAHGNREFSPPTRYRYEEPLRAHENGDVFYSTVRSGEHYDLEKGKRSRSLSPKKRQAPQPMYPKSALHIFTQTASSLSASLAPSSPQSQPFASSPVGNISPLPKPNKSVSLSPSSQSAKSSIPGLNMEQSGAIAAVHYGLISAKVSPRRLVDTASFGKLHLSVFPSVMENSNKGSKD